MYIKCTTAQEIVGNGMYCTYIGPFSDVSTESRVFSFPLNEGSGGI